ncbi:pilus assembly protein PilO [Anoxybacillus sp. UARK-01]|uniref:Type II secretion system protein GspM n=1 Tax=Anoxybacteroides rupiense TaxID=311460 RepID=A0ABD5IS49_9BACL|nr:MULTISPECIES: type II secretion system protein GspM [Anoxybacillus]MBB3907194.1 type IV pilus assembly protein PilO [Anoxybacillus rupiensis]MED5051023.1 type II secretion system protein GspM [Anoxybacillus rupiensis]OQM45713.1 pilus assembly protein PilO [Anoxybacillus sp. UARK-01]
MIVRFSKRQLLVSLLALVLVGTSVVLLYFYTLKPLYSRLEELRTTVENEKKLLATMQTQAEQQQTDRTASVVELQKKVPVKPLVEQLILDLEKAEVLSDSLISGMSFNEEADVNGQPPADSAQGQENGTQARTKEQSAAQKTDSAAPSLPQGLKKVTAQLTVQSPSYYHLERFLQTLEKLDRIVSVETLSFSGNPELTSIDTQTEPLTYSLTISAFYHPGLAKLQKQTPPLDVPSPSGKRNPLTELLPDDGDEER